jgi:hypothetical protein
MDPSTIATIVTAIAAAAISYILQKPYVRVVKMFRNGTATSTVYKLKNAGAATAICVVLQDRYGHVIDLDLALSQRVRYVDALPQEAEITIGVPDSGEPVNVYYENLFGLLFRTQLTDAGNRFRMTARKVWPLFDAVPDAVFSELPSHWWRRRG